MSIVIPTRNGADTLPGVLEAISHQLVDFRFETVAIDSGSTDGTVALLDRQVDKVIAIDSNDFDHGLTRNRAVDESKGEFIVVMVQDAVPANDTWLRSLVAPLLCDGTLAGTFARQIPRPEASALARHYLRLWIAAGEVGRVVSLSGAAQLASMTPHERLRHCAFDDAARASGGPCGSTIRFEALRSLKISSGRGKCCCAVTG